VAEIGNAEFRAHRAEMVHQMQQFLGYREKCRRLELLRHFQPGASSSMLGLRVSRDCCDCCTARLLSNQVREGGNLEAATREDAELDLGTQARLFLEAVAMVGDARGVGTSVKVVMGSNDNKLFDRWKQSEVFGKGKGRSAKFWTALGRELISKSYLKEVKQSMGNVGFSRKPFTYSGLAVTPKGSSFLSTEDPLLLKPIGDLQEARPKVKPSVATIAPKFGSDSRPQDVERTNLYNQLLAERKKLSLQTGLAPYMVLREQSLLQLAQVKPTSMDGLKKIDGMTDAKITSYGGKFLSVIHTFLEKSGGKVVGDEFSEVDERLSLLGLSETVQNSYHLFKTHLDVSKVAALRNLKDSTIMGHLAVCLEAGVDVPLEAAGVPPELVSTVARVVWRPPLASDVLRIGAIREEVIQQEGVEVDWGKLKLAVAQLVREHGKGEDGRLLWTREDVNIYTNSVKSGNASSNHEKSICNHATNIRGANSVVSPTSQSRSKGDSKSPEIKSSYFTFKKTSPNQSDSSHGKSPLSTLVQNDVKSYRKLPAEPTALKEIDRIMSSSNRPPTSPVAAERKLTEKQDFRSKLGQFRREESETSGDVSAPAPSPHAPLLTTTQQGKRKKIPAWMMSAEGKDEMARKKMKANSLFK